MEALKLLKPTEAYAEQIKEYKEEFLAHNSSMDGCSSLRHTDDPYVFIENCRRYAKKETVPAPLVPEDLYLLVRADDDRLLGMIDIRHELNDHLAAYGGHIGYSIRPSERRRGYAKKMLQMALVRCRELGLSRVLITCNQDNIASERTILACGGSFDGERTKPDDGVTVKRYWIALDSKK